VVRGRNDHHVISYDVWLGVWLGKEW
jgi:hypothetical protein